MVGPLPWLTTALLACTAGTGSDTGEQTGATASDSGQTGTADSGGDTGDSGTAAPTCPDDMVPVGPAGAPPDFCIDPYEVTVDGDLGDPDQHSGMGAATSATTASLAGVVPTTLVSYGQAVGACANTPAGGGFKRLPTFQEWEDAADGVVGEGGFSWPYGDTWDDEACATPTADGTVVLKDTQPTGSYPDCVSPFGVYDAVGNAWEWTDSGRVLDVEGFFGTAASVGVDVSLGSGDTILAGAGATDRLVLRMQGLLQRTPSVAADGTLYLPPEGFDDNALGITFSGYLVVLDGPADAATLPVFFDVPVRESTDEGPVATDDEPLYVLWEADGATVPDKRGCAWYTGSEEGCRITSGSLDHLHDFLGTISFRCVADPA